jgi:EAL domain-containing protein (putative c-di-GMP-specific phosphodiesterase class I)
VKVDGKLIERLGKSEREDAILKTVLESCAAMKIETIAEWIDSPGKLKACLDFGFTFGQGRQFGEPLHKLPGQDREILRVRRFPGTAQGRPASSSGQR